MDTDGLTTGSVLEANVVDNLFRENERAVLWRKVTQNADNKGKLKHQAFCRL